MALKAAAAPIRLVPGTLIQHHFRPQRAAHSLKVAAVVVAIITIGDAHYRGFALSCMRYSHDEDCSHLAH